MTRFGNTKYSFKLKVLSGLKLTINDGVAQRYVDSPLYCCEPQSRKHERGRKDFSRLPEQGRTEAFFSDVKYAVE